MKRNDIAAIVLIVAVAGVISYFVANAVIGQPKNNPVQVEQITSIGPNFPNHETRLHALSFLSFQELLSPLLRKLLEPNLYPTAL